MEFIKMKEIVVDRPVLDPSSDNIVCQQFLDFAGVIIVAINAKGEVIYINQTGLDILGYTSKQVIGKNWFKLIIPKNESVEVRKVFDKLMQGKTKLVGHYQNSIKTKTGEVKFIDWYNTLLKDKKGKIIGTLSSGADITNLDITKSQLAEIEKKYKAIVNQITEGIVLFNSAGVILEVNKKAAQICGHSQIKMINMNIADICDPKTYPNISETIKTIFKSNRNQEIKGLEFDIDKKNKIVIDLTAQVVGYNGDRVGLLILKDNTTEQKTLEQVEKSMKKFQILANETADGIIITDEIGRLAYANLAVTHMFGYSDPNEMLGTPIQNFLAGSSIVQAANLLKSAMAGKLTGIKNQYFKAIKKNKDKFDIDVSASVFWEDGKFSGIECIIRDLSSNKNEIKKYLDQIAELEAENKNLKWKVGKLKKK